MKQTEIENRMKEMKENVINNNRIIEGKKEIK